jgi:putative transposase
MALDSNKGHAALRRGRLSHSSADYFLTLCAEARHVGLTTKSVAEVILNESRAMAADGTWALHTAVIMPDHIHLLVVLGERLPLGKAVQRLKAKTSAGLRFAGLAWERSFFDRRLRPNDDRLAVFRYIHLNPYRAGLIAASEQWPHYYCRAEEWSWFKELLHLDRPCPERLA